jgi:hypothetical protein
VITVEEGTSAASTYRQTSVNFVLATDPVVFASFGTSAPSASETTAGIAEIATQAETNAGTDDLRIVTPLKLTTFIKRAQNTQIGDGSSIQYDITHNWNTRNVLVEVVRVASPYDTINPTISRPTVNAVRINFATGLAPSTNQFVVLLREN